MGIYGSVSYIVILRTREIGIRMAVGAQRRDILGLILRESTRPVITGLFVGMFLAAGASHLLRGLLFGLNTVDGISFIGVPSCFWPSHCLPRTHRPGKTMPLSSAWESGQHLFSLRGPETGFSK